MRQLCENKTILLWEPTELHLPPKVVCDTLPVCRTLKQSDVKIKCDYKNQQSVLYLTTRELSVNRNYTSPTLAGPTRLYQGSGSPSCTTPRQLTIYVNNFFNNYFSIPLTFFTATVKTENCSVATTFTKQKQFGKNFLQNFAQVWLENPSYFSFRLVRVNSSMMESSCRMMVYLFNWSNYITFKIIV